MSRQLKTVVLVNGVVYGPGYEQDIPEHVAKRITNPVAWGEQREESSADTAGDGVPGDHEQLAAGLLPHAPVQPNQVTMAAPAGDGGVNPLLPDSADTGSSAVPAGAGTPTGVPSATEPLDETGVLQDGAAATAGGEQAGGQLAEPPRSGRGATTAAWREYAEQLGVEVDEDAERGDIIAQLKESGHIQ